MKRIALVLSGVLFIAYFAALTLVSQPDADVPYVRTDILEKNPTPFGRGWISIQGLIDGDLIYSHYDDTGNPKNIVQLDFTSGHWTNLVSGKAEPKLIAQDARYTVFSPHRYFRLS